jgi:hypothetical protein
MTSKELVVNKGLSGEETKQLIRRDFERLLSNEGLLSPHVAYGRIAWDVRLRLHMQNPLLPESESHVKSQRAGRNIIADEPGLAAVEPLPLTPAPDSATISASEISHEVSSPNLERVHAGLPVPVNVKQNDGTTTQEQVTYPKPDTSEFPPPLTPITDVTEAAKRDLARDLAR